MNELTPISNSYELLYYNGMIEVIEKDIAIARLYKSGENYLVKIFKDGYDFTADSIDTALKLIKIRLG